MSKPCTACVAGCGVVLRRFEGVGLSFLDGRCARRAEWKELTQRWWRVEEAVSALPFDLGGLVSVLGAWSADAPWAATPRRPDALQVLLDALAERGFDVHPRGLAELVCRGARIPSP